jgi:L-asparaginase
MDAGGRYGTASGDGRSAVLSRVAVVFTGGTISMESDATAGGNVPRLDGAAILRRTPGLADIADVVPIDRGLIPASHFTFPQLFDLATAVDDASAGDVDGVVVVQGTDTIEETSFFLDLVLHTDKPVVVTGAMRAASQPGYDGPANVRDAVRCAASPALHGQGVVVVLAGSIDGADDVTKTHTSSYDTFRSLNFGPLGHVDGRGVTIARHRAGRRRVTATRAATRVHLIEAHVAMDGALVDAAMVAGCDGLVVEATGAGNTSALLLESCAAAMRAGIPVALTTRCPAGRASADYAFPGGGATWVKAGAMLAGHLGGPKARVALALGLGAGLDRGALAALLADPA